MKLANEKKEKKIPGGSHKEAIFFFFAISYISIQGKVIENWKDTEDYIVEMLFLIAEMCPGWHFLYPKANKGHKWLD